MPRTTWPSLPDYLSRSLRVLFVGINPGLRSAQVGHHFAGHSNRFWKLLSDSKLIPFPLTYRDDARLLEWGIGLTNLVSRPTAGMHELTKQDYREGRIMLMNKIETFHPRIVALLGLGIARLLFSESSEGAFPVRRPSLKIIPGLQSNSLCQTPIFVLPNPSGRNAHYSYQSMSHLYQMLRHTVDSMSNN